MSKNSILSLPKKPSIRALSGEWPLRDMERTIPRRQQIDAQLRAWYWPPRSLCTTRPGAGVARGHRGLEAGVGEGSADPAEVDIRQPGGYPS